MTNKNYTRARESVLAKVSDINFETMSQKAYGGGVDLETQAWECDKWPAWLHKVVDQTSEVADRLDMSSEQAHAYAALVALSRPSPALPAAEVDRAIDAYHGDRTFGPVELEKERVKMRRVLAALRNDGGE